MQDDGCGVVIQAPHACCHVHIQNRQSLDCDTAPTIWLILISLLWRKLLNPNVASIRFDPNCYRSLIMVHDSMIHVKRVSRFNENYQNSLEKMYFLGG